MKKSIISTLALGLIVGAGAMTINSFANEREVNTMGYTNAPSMMTNNQQNTPQGEAGFKVLNEETNTFEKLDDSQYRNNNQGLGSCCSFMNSGNYGYEDIK